MEAPEKIYIDDPTGEFNDNWSIYSNNISTEYFRTDAFIEKAEKYLKDQFIKDVSVLASGVISINFSTAIKNFVNYMKGEEYDRNQSR